MRRLDPFLRGNFPSLDVTFPLGNGDLQVLGRDSFSRVQCRFLQGLYVRGPQRIASFGELPPRVERVELAACVDDLSCGAFREAQQVLVQKIFVLANISKI